MRRSSSASSNSSTFTKTDIRATPHNESCGALRKFCALTLLRFHGNTSSITAKPRLVSTQNLLANRSCPMMRYCLKFSFLTETLTLPCYDGGTKSERVMKIELREKGSGADRAADGRSRHAVLRCLAGRGGDSAEQSNQIMSGVCGNWVKSFQAFHRPCPASGAGFRRVRRC